LVGGSLATEECTCEVGVDHVMPECLGHLQKGRPVHDAGVANKDIQLPECRDRRGDHPSDALAIRYINLVRERCCAGLLEGVGCLTCRLFVDVGKDYPPTALRHPFGNRVPNTMCCTGDYSNFGSVRHDWFPFNSGSCCLVQRLGDYVVRVPFSPSKTSYDAWAKDGMKGTLVKTYTKSALASVNPRADPRPPRAGSLRRRD
jgi:hypothetical protein